MYHYVENKSFLKQMKRFCSDIINQLVQNINNESIMKVEANLIGSGAKNLITQNANEPIDLDYNLLIKQITNSKFHDEKAIKKYIQSRFDDVLQKNNLNCSHDSTSAITTNIFSFKNETTPSFKIDLGIIRKINGNFHRLIHQKTGDVNHDQWYWNQVKNSKNIEKKVADIKTNNLWSEVRTVYLEKKNRFLKRSDSNHPSYIVYFETINEIYYKYFNKIN